MAINQSSKSGSVKQYLLPSINAPTAATQAPFFSSAELKAYATGSSLTPKERRPSLGSKRTFTTSPGPKPFLKSAPSLLEPFLSLPVEQQAQPSLMSEKAFLTLGISECLTIPILKQVPLRILISQQQTPLRSIRKSPQLFLYTPTEVRTETVLCLSSRNTRYLLRLRVSQLRQTKFGCIQIYDTIDYHHHHPPIPTSRIFLRPITGGKIIRHHIQPIRIVNHFQLQILPVVIIKLLVREHKEIDRKAVRTDVLSALAPRGHTRRHQWGVVKCDPVDLLVINSVLMSEIEDSTLKNYKTIIIGRSAVGKSTLLLRYVDGEYNPQKPTIGIDYRFKKVTHANTTFNLELWDSAGQERYRTIVYNYFTLSKAACVVFDLTNEDSLADAKVWLQQLVLHCGNDIPKLLLGNKSDLLNPTALTEQLEKYKQRIDELKAEYNCEFFAVSALTGQNINEAFGYLIKEIYQRNKVATSDIKSNNLKLSKVKVAQNVETKKDKKCC